MNNRQNNNNNNNQNRPTNNRTQYTYTPANSKNNNTNNSQYNPYNNPQYQYEQIQKQRRIHGVVPREYQKANQEEHKIYTVPYRYKPRPKKSKIPIYAMRFLIFLLITIFLFGIFSLVFYINLIHKVKKSDVLFEIDIPITEKEVGKPFTKSVPYDIVYKDEVLFIPFMQIVEKLGFVTSGNKDEYSFSISETNEYMRINIKDNKIIINDVDYHIAMSAFEYEGDLYLPLDFVKNNIKGIIIDSTDENKITVSRNENISTLSFKILSPVPTPHLDELENFTQIYQPFEFLTDVSEYTEYFSPPDQDEYIALINNDNPIIPTDYAPSDLVDVRDTRSGLEMQRLRLYPAKALEALLNEAKARGYTTIFVNSAYRDYASQSILYNNEVANLTSQYGDNYLDSVTPTTMPPGHSEHQSGMALDMHSALYTPTGFGSSEEGVWLAENAHNFGYILRYPEDKTDITNIDYEPWHFRYVGKYHATQMYKLDMCLEEYHDYLKENSLLNAQ